MYLGGNKNNNYYSLTNNNINTINTSNNVLIYLAGYCVNGSYKTFLINIIYQWYTFYMYMFLLSPRGQ